MGEGQSYRQPTHNIFYLTQEAATDGATAKAATTGAAVKTAEKTAAEKTPTKGN